jgi:hypothetical protein
LIGVKGTTAAPARLSFPSIGRTELSDIRTNDGDDAELDPAVVETEENREAAAEGENGQDFRSERETAGSHTAFGDDKVTPRLNDGR